MSSLRLRQRIQGCGFALLIGLVLLSTVFLLLRGTSAVAGKSVHTDAYNLSTQVGGQRQSAQMTVGVDSIPWMSGGPYGASIRSIAVSPAYVQDHTVFAGSWGSGVFRLDDATGQWQPRSNPSDHQLIRTVRVSPAFPDDHTLFIATAEGDVYTSTDEGLNWALATNGLPLGHSIADLAVSPNYAADRVLYVAPANEGVYRSQDGGVGWSPITAGLGMSTVMEIAFAPSFSGTGMVYTRRVDSKLFRADNGVNWMPLADLPIAGEAHALALSPNGGMLFVGTCSGVVTSTDQGVSWHVANAGIESVSIEDIQVSPQFNTDQTVWACSFSDGIYRSTNAGASWTRVLSNTNGDFFCGALAVPPNFSAAGTIFAGNLGGAGGVYRSTNGGNQWQPRSAGLTWNVTALAPSSDYANDQTVYTGLNGGAVYRSHNRGASWEAAHEGYPIGADANVIALSPQYRQDGTLFAVGYGTGVQRSTDRGQTWSRVGLTNVYALIDLAVAPQGLLTQSLILAGSEYEGAFRSNDGGTTWAPITQGLPISRVNDIAFSLSYASDHTVFIASDGQGVWRSQDNGSNWSPLATGPLGTYVWMLAVSPDYTTDHTLFASSSNGLFRSQNHGGSWAKQPFSDTFGVTDIAFSPHYTQDRTIWAATTKWSITSTGGVFVSENGGASWRQINLGLPELDNWSIATADRGGSSYDVFVGTHTRSVWQLSVAPPATTWTVMIYLNGDNNLDGWTAQLFNKLEKAVAMNSSLVVTVLWDRSSNGDTVLYRVLPDANLNALANYSEGVNKWLMGELDMGNPDTLVNFVNTARMQYPSDHYLLAIVDHGGGWSVDLLPSQAQTRWAVGGSGFSWDETNEYHYLSTSDMKNVFTRTLAAGGPIDVVFYDACLMAMLEEAYQIRGGARYLVASENETWASFPYDEYLAGLSAAAAPWDVATRIVDKYHASLAGYPRTMSVLDIDQIGQVTMALDTLSQALIDSLPGSRDTISQAYRSAQKLDYNYDLKLESGEGFVDLASFAAELANRMPGTPAGNAAQVLSGTLSSLVVYERHQSDVAWPTGQMVNLDRVRGMSIYLPAGTYDSDQRYYLPEQLDLAKDTLWDNFITAFAPLPPGSLPPDGKGRNPNPAPIQFRLFLPLTIRGT
jgi:photosystem II stability/assembly factor-like uncharacterized protein